jgi:regulator of RNase E activity RraB
LIKELGYELLSSCGLQEQESGVYGLQIRKRDRVDQESIDKAVLEILRFAMAVDGEYDSWETEIVRAPSPLKLFLMRVGMG